MPPRHMTVGDFGQLLLLAVLFGSAFLFIRLTAPVFGPLFLMDARVLLAAGMLVLWAALTGQRLYFGRRWRDWLIVGALNAAFPYTLIAFAELHVSSSLAAIFMATIPLFTALITVVWLKERLTLKLAAGLATGFASVLVLSGWGTLASTPVTLLALAALLAATFSYALGIVFVSQRFKGTPPLTLSVGNFLAAGVLLLPFALSAPPPQPPSFSAVLTLAALALIPTAVALVLDFHLLEKLGPLRLSTVTYLIPAAGALLGFVFLGEPVKPATLLGLTTVLFSVGLVTDTKLELPKKRLQEALKGKRPL